jgi:hypothetical protein
MAPHSEDSWVASQRKEYEEDPFKWLDERFRHVNRWTERQAEWQTNQAKEFAENVAQSLTVSLEYTRGSLVLWLGLIACVALASAGLWIGVGGVALVVIGFWYRGLLWVKTLERYDRFRNDYFRKLLEAAEGGRYGEGSAEKMLEEDKQFVLKCRDSILYPHVVPAARRKTVYQYDLERIETLYREYCSMPHLHRVELPYSDPNCYRDADLKCELCRPRRRVQEHVEGVVSKFEGDVESARRTLIARIDEHNSIAAIDAKDFLEQYREWERRRNPYLSDEWVPEPELLASLLKRLRDKENWTFAEAVEVHELCRKERGERQAITDDEKRAAQLSAVLTNQIEAAAKRFEVGKVWQFYDEGKQWLWGGTGSSFEIATRHVLNNLRRAFQRSHPETTFGELVTSNGMHSSGIFQLEWLKNYGFDKGMVEKELESGWKVVQKERKRRTEDRRMLATASAFLYSEELAHRTARW